MPIEEYDTDDNVIAYTHVLRNDFGMLIEWYDECRLPARVATPPTKESEDNEDN